MLLVSGLLTMQSCTKETLVPIKAYVAAVPANPTPASDAVLPYSTAPINLTWEQGAAKVSSWNVTIMLPDNSEVHATTTTNSYSYTPSMSGQFLWNVNTKDANGITSTSVTLGGGFMGFLPEYPSSYPGS